MKFNKILSSALALIMLFSAAVGLFPMKSGAAYIENTASELNAPENVTEYVKEVYGGKIGDTSSFYPGYKFNTAEEMLMYEKALGYLTSVVSSDGRYAIYVNAYTGVLYYQNRVTGQILTSNPWAYGYSEEVNKNLLSQISINFTTISTSAKTTYTSTEWAAMRSQISTEHIKEGIRVNYTFGDTEARYLLPGAMPAEKFEEIILVPMIETLISLMEEYCEEEFDGEFDAFNNPTYSESIYTEEGYLYNTNLLKYVRAMKSIFDKQIKRNEPGYSEINDLIKDISTMIANYTLKLDEYLVPAYALKKMDSNANAQRSVASNLFRKYCGSYNIVEMIKDEEVCGYIDNTAQKPVFNCALEYGFNEDGSLSVRLPANSISFDETIYTLDSLTVLQFFGAGDTTKDGYIFYPDGSGAVLEFSEFNNVRAFVYGTVYGIDYCYSNIKGANREQITMPVFGLVSTVNANESTSLAYGTETVTNGYFSILEEGESLANLYMELGGPTYRYGSAYCSYTPYPSDLYDLSETLSVSGATSYTIVSESKYNGSYVTRYVMLTDAKIAEIVGTDYVTDYVGMAKYYRDYLYNNGTLSAIELVGEDLPLYLEVLGSMEVIKKILSFPITTSTPLTTFENVREMYEDLAYAKDVYADKAAEYDKLAAEAETPEEAEHYRDLAEESREFASEIQNITNINVRLTGFYNGGLYSTYPTKLKWSKACGGKSEYKKLLNYANSVTNGNSNFGVYADFDFSYIGETSMTDGIRIKGNVSRMVDNRYASQQLYNSVLQAYESHYSLVVNPESFETLYSKFIKKYSKYEYNRISVSTLGSDLNSNFDEDQPVNRDDSQSYVENLLAVMTEENGFDVMIDLGNIYSVKYASHILGANIDSSHFLYSSYTVPFVGMILHGSVNYTGSAINYSGTTAYDILRAIESGANIYYILCYQNSGYMKEDLLLSDYYGVSYSYWYESILETYKEINDAIGDLQNAYITDHMIIKGERVIESNEWLENYEDLMDEFLVQLRIKIDNEVDTAYKQLIEGGEDYGKSLKVVVDVNSILNWFQDQINLDFVESAEESEEESYEASLSALIKEFYASVEDIVEEFETQYAGGENSVTVTIDEENIAYDSVYSFVTDSIATESDYDYEYTNYTSDIGNIALVTYSDGTKFILNYNIYAVEVNLGGGNVYTLGKYEYVKIGGNN